MTFVSRFVIGIDLGTTNSAVAYFDTDRQKNPSGSIQPFRIPQLVESGRLDVLPTLPSCCYLAADGEMQAGELRLPWQVAGAVDHDYFIGEYALHQGARVPTRLVQSAKSWLCHVAAKRQEKVLPLEAADQSRRISPVEATARILSHIKEAWNHRMGGGDAANEFEQQEVVLTVPASFDEVARTLTVHAAKRAGFTKMTLLEEPQAALYSWIGKHEKRWEQHFTAGDRILVCDVGGGTTDLSLIEVKKQGNTLSLQRQQVGPHLLLGGDNMDAAIAHYLAKQLDTDLDSIQWQQLHHQARRAKEQLLGGDDSSYTVVIQGGGSSVIGGSLTTTVTRDLLQTMLVDGFFGCYEWSEALNLKRTTGMRTMGLPYENEPSITKHIAHFLSQAGTPNFVLFNGGTMKSPLFQRAVLDSLQQWFPDAKPQILDSTSLDLAVSRGAAYNHNFHHVKNKKLYQ